MTPEQSPIAMHLVPTLRRKTEFIPFVLHRNARPRRLASPGVVADCEIARRPSDAERPSDAFPSRAWERAAVAVLGLLLCALSSGCVQRRMTVRTNPPGALLYVDDYEIGTTPVSLPFTYYGTRKIRLVKDGYETLTTMQPIPPPWYQIVPIDFIAENCVPGQIRDQRTLDFQLQPQAIVPTEQLLGRAEQLRRGVHAAGGVPAMAGSPNSPAPLGPSGLPPPAGAEVVPAPEGVGGQPVHSLPPR
jgi:hypothetical protein